MSSTIFERNPQGMIVPRQDARVRIYLGEKEQWRTYGRRRQMIGKEKVYELCELLEFWPDHDYRMKMRGRVWVRPTPKLLETYAGRPGVAYDEDWMELRETEIHQEDRENLYIHCARKLDGGALIIHQARPALDEIEQKGNQMEKPQVPGVYDLDEHNKLVQWVKDNKLNYVAFANEDILVVADTELVGEGYACSFENDPNGRQEAIEWMVGKYLEENKGYVE